MSDRTLRELVYGKGAHVNPVACVEGISAELAVRTVAGYPHSIWQLVEHMNYWMDYDLRMIAGENPTYPNHASESWPEPPGSARAERWQAVTERFGQLLKRLTVLAESDSAVLMRIVVKAEPSNLQRQCMVHTALWEIVAHNSYHIGQVALLRRQAGAWPPERGGDTW
ncbi:MAG: DinB family protein [Terriglobales bacterium]